ncbi:hypothetical protein BX666DRAFT_2000328 [Dichotomocladium elegans]|nr:hypothetical protein BX666DRAFT_2000328 [Dichotomocladium elegans]
MTALDDWVLHLIIGTGLAVHTATQGGIGGDLAFSDLLLLLRAQFCHPQQVSGDNVVIGFDSLWARMMIKKFESRRLSSCYLLLDKHTHPRCGCAMARGPDFPVRPNMFYGLITDYQEFKVVHRSHCIDGLVIDVRATEFAPTALRTRLEGATNQTALSVCRSIVAKMEEDVAASPDATPWDKDMMTRIVELMDNIEISNPAVKTVEALDRIHMRLSRTLARLELTSFVVKGVSYTINDVYFACIICLGIRRGKAMSDYIYEAHALMFMGYNINVAREIIQDSSRVAAIAEEPDHYSTRMQLDTTSYPRLVDIPVADGYVFFGQLLDGVLTTALFCLTRIDPILCMALSRKFTEPYRGRRGHLSTSLSWSVDRAMLRYTGLARDDWMGCIVPSKSVNRWISLYMALSLLMSLIPIYLLSTLPQYIFPSQLLQKVIIASIIVAACWTASVVSMHQLRLREAAAPFIVYSTVLAVAATYMRWKPVLQTFVGGAFLLQWLLGELHGSWIHRCTVFFAFGVLGASRCIA